MKITVLGEMVSIVGDRLTLKEVRVYTLQYPFEQTYGDYTVQERVYHNPKVVIDKMLNKTFEGVELDTHVEVNLNMVL
jgi:hypothetical protein